MTAPVSLIVPYTCLVPAGTAQATPAAFQMTLPPLDIAWLEWTVPPGPGGDVGFWIGSAGQPIIPYTVGAPYWIVTDDEKVHWDLVDQPDSGDWQLQAYNLGVRDHSIYVRWGLAPPAPAPVTPPQVITGPILSGQTPSA